MTENLCGPSDIKVWRSMQTVKRSPSRSAIAIREFRGKPDRGVLHRVREKNNLHDVRHELRGQGSRRNTSPRQRIGIVGQPTQDLGRGSSH